MKKNADIAKDNFTHSLTLVFSLSLGAAYRSLKLTTLTLKSFKYRQNY